MQTPGLTLNQVVTTRARLPALHFGEILDCICLLIFRTESPGVCRSSTVSTRLPRAFLACPNITHDNSRRQEFRALRIAAVQGFGRGELEHHLLVIRDKLSRQA